MLSCVNFYFFKAPSRAGEYPGAIVILMGTHSVWIFHKSIFISEAVWPTMHCYPFYISRLNNFR